MGYLDQCKLVHLKADLALRPLTAQEREVAELLLDSGLEVYVNTPFARDAAARRLVDLDLAAYDEFGDEDDEVECEACGQLIENHGHRTGPRGLKAADETQQITATELLIELRDRGMLGEIGL